MKRTFDKWWYQEGSGMRPVGNEDAEKHVERVSGIAWSNGKYAAERECEDDIAKLKQSVSHLINELHERTENRYELLPTLSIGVFEKNEGEF